MKRVLAIDPINKGFGFAVLDGPRVLLDWGLKGTTRMRGPRERWCLRQIDELIDSYQPDRILVEDCRAPGSRRGKRCDALIAKIAKLAQKRGLPARRIALTRMRRVWRSAGACTKYKVALAIAGRFPELAWRLPPIRKPWMSEDARMGIFDAVALALAFYGRHATTQEGSSDAVSVSALNGGETTPSVINRR